MMGEMADLDYDRQFSLAHFPESPDRPKYSYTHRGEKYWFHTVEQANRWAKKKGFKLSTTTPTKSIADSKEKK